MRITSPQALADALQQARKHKGQTQSAIGELAGIKQSTVSGFETAPENARVETLFKLLSALDLELVLNARDSQQNAGTSSGQAWDQEW